jgi:tetratricopeptide (TPR) repeat protein
LRRTWRWFAHQPRALQIGLILVVLTGLAAGAYYGRSFVKKRLTDREVGAAWREHAHAVGKGDVDDIRAALERVLAITPDDPTAKRHLSMLDRGEADADESEIAFVLMQEHIRKDRLVEAAREGEKVLVKHPKNWHARCVVAHHALQVKKDRSLAEQHLSQLADPDDPAAMVTAGGVLYALKLSDTLGRDAANLRRLIVRRLLPFLGGGTAAGLAAAGKVQLLECYLEPFTDRSLLGELADYLGVVDRLADSAVAEAVSEGNVDVLVRLARFGPRMRAALAMIRANDPVRLPDDRALPLVKAADERTRRAWLAVVEKDATRAEAYLGLANLAILTRDYNAALAQVAAGIKACGERVDLLDLQLALIAHYKPQEELRRTAEVLQRAAVAAKTDPAKWCLVAKVWILLHRNDFAQMACDEALAIQKDHALACRLKASILVDSGSTSDLISAGDLIGRLGELAPRVDPGLAQINARIMVGRGAWVLVEDEFNKVLETRPKLQSKSSMAAVGFLLGVLGAPPDVERAEWVAARAARVTIDDPQSAGARLVRFEALYRLAELSVTFDQRTGQPVWDTAHVAAALRAFEELALEERTRATVLARVAALQLKAERNAVVALRTASGLLEVEGALNAFEIEVLGSILTANGRAGEAVRLLERGEKRPRPTVGLRVALALAYHANNQPLDRDAAVRRAENSGNRSPREHAELIAAKQRINREKM